MTENERETTIRALLEERRGYQQRGLDDRVAQIDELLRKLGAAGTTPAKRAATRKTKTA